MIYKICDFDKNVIGCVECDSYEFDVVDGKSFHYFYKNNELIVMFSANRYGVIYDKEV